MNKPLNVQAAEAIGFKPFYSGPFECWMMEGTGDVLRLSVPPYDTDDSAALGLLKEWRSLEKFRMFEIESPGDGVLENYIVRVYYCEESSASASDPSLARAICHAIIESAKGNKRG